MRVKTYDGRAVWSGRLGDGTVVRFRPSPLTGRWLADARTSAGEVLFSGRPVAVGSDLFELARVRGALGTLNVSGPSDPDQSASLPSQGTALDFEPPAA